MIFFGAPQPASTVLYIFTLESFSPTYTSVSHTAQEKLAREEIRNVSTQRSVSGHFA